MMDSTNYFIHQMGTQGESLYKKKELYGHGSFFSFLNRYKGKQRMDSLTGLEIKYIITEEYGKSCWQVRDKEEMYEIIKLPDREGRDGWGTFSR